MKIDYTNNVLNNPEMLQGGNLKPRATVVPSLKKDVYFKNKESSSLIQILNGEYKFCYQNDDCIENFYSTDYNDLNWDNIDVPSMWQYRGYGKPAYPNTEYPIPFNPPYVFCDNPVGYYRKSFTARKTAKSILYFGGVDNAYFVYLNGKYVGFSKGSRLPCEFDVTDILLDGENLLCVKVFTYSDATYLENQDMLLTNGIFRDILLFNLGECYVFDYYTRTEDGKILIDVTLEGDLNNCTVKCEADGKICEKKAENNMHFEFDIENIKYWNAEEPNLYSTYITLLKDGKPLEIHSKRIGFRKSETKGNRLLLNGTPITIKGICRHEHDPKNGKAITVEFIEKELKNIKSHNLNAIRCSHYPNNPAFYEIASELGIYVMNEGDIETHGCGVIGDQGYISKKPEWKKAFLNRTERMIERDKNETCVIIWSVGNEHGCGENVNDCIKMIRKKFGNVPAYHTMDDPKNPLICDFRADGYFTMASIMSYAPEGKPVMLTEYGHAMGNSPGLMEDTWDYVYRNRHIVGGYLWEYKSHGFYNCDADGNDFYEYGGDFNDYSHWSNFSIDGYCLSDGTAKPSLRDSKNVLSPCYVTHKGGKINLLNTNDFKSLDYITLHWEICEDYKVIKQGKMQLPAVKPYEEYTLPLDLTINEKTAGAKYYINLRFLEEDGKLNAFKQFLIAENTKQPYISEKPCAEISADKKIITVKSDNFEIKLCNGLLCYYLKDGKVLLEKQMKLNFYRAPTDNDGIVGWSERWITKWQGIFLKHWKFFAQTADITEEDSCIKISVTGKILPISHFVGFNVNLIYRIYSSGIILITYTGEPFGELTDVIPRIGVMLEADKSFYSVKWYGRGEEENYCDRKAHCNFGLYQSDIENLNFIYDVPQECGNHQDTYFVQLISNDKTLTVIGSEKFAFSCHDFTFENLENARHRNELKKSPEKYLYIDYKMRGLGSHSCGPEPEECYELHPHSFRFAFAICDEADTEKALALSRSKFCSTTEKLSDSYVYKVLCEEKSIIECDL